MTFGYIFYVTMNNFKRYPRSLCTCKYVKSGGIRGGIETEGKWYVHKEFGMGNFDIALIKLKDPLPCDDPNIKPVTCNIYC